MARLVDANEITYYTDEQGFECAYKVDIDNLLTIDPESLHRERTVATNADCIRAMSDEKLANQLVIEVDGLEPCRLYLSAPTGKLYVTRTEATRNALEWLQQPTEED